MSLVPRFVYGDLDLTDFPYSVEFGSDFGNPENAVDVISSMLLDGEVLESNRRSNRLLVVPVMIEDADMLALASAEAALIAECDKRTNTLAVEPGDGIGPTTVFETFRAQPRWKREDNEEQANVRRFVLEIPALPHTRSVDPVTDASATPPAAAGTVVNALDSTTGWTSLLGAVAPVSDTAIKAQGTASVRTTCGPYPYFNETFTADGYQFTTGYGIDEWVLSQAVTAGEWSSIKARFEWAAPTEAGTSGFQQIQQTVGGVTTTVTPQISAPDANGFITYSWRQSATGTLTKLKFSWQQWQTGWGSNGGVPYPHPNVWYDALTSTPAGAGGKQIVKTFEVEGSARAPGSLHIAAPTDLDALGQVFAATMPSADVATGFTPDVVRWVTSGTTTVDATSLNGVTYAPGSTYGAAGSMVAAVPVSILTPGPYNVYALVKRTSDPLTIGVEAQLMANGSTASGPALTVEVTVPNPVSSVWRFVPVGTLDLPPVEMVNPSSSASVRLRTKGNCVIGEILLLPARGLGRVGADVTIVDCGTGTVSASAASSHLWLESPTAARRYGGAFRGPTANGLNRRAASFDDLKKPGVHYWTPGQMTSYVISAGIAGTNVTLTHTPHWFGNAAL